ncbi:hypothetical protein AGMMS50218_12340 [Actinomycetota bacterium]|nr:hypothetical protein AGMMS50218_12340 [Actinomycetota bacterium]
MSDNDQARGRQLRRRHRHERQAVIFGALLALLAVTGFGAAAVYTGTLKIPLLERGFSSPSPTGLEQADSPCIPTGALPVAYSQITVNVFNGAGRVGLAGATANDLRARGFVIGATENAPASVQAGAVIRFGTAGIAQAYTLAAHLDDPVMVLDTRADASVDLTVGQGFNTLVPAGSVVLDTTIPLVSPAGCVPLDQVVPVPGPTPTPAPPAEEPPADAATEGAEG